MVRSISTAAQAKLDQDIGTEPINIIEIQWIDGGSIYTYADKNLSGDEGKILDVSSLDNTVVIQGVSSGTSGDSQQISVTVDDTDGTIKDIMDNNDIHKQSAWVYQSFQGLSSSDKFLIFKGQISSPLQWNEGDRTVSFDILTRIEDAEVGFSMEEGNFGAISEDLVGKPWPLVFGTVKSCPALKTSSPRVGILKTGFGIKDYMLAPKGEQANNVCCPYKFAGFNQTYPTPVADILDPLSGVWGNGRLRITPVYIKDASCVCKQRATICEVNLKLAKQSAFEFGTIDLVDGQLFPQGIELTLSIKGARLTGKFLGTDTSPVSVFTITHRQHPKQVLGDPVAQPIQFFGCIPDLLSGSPYQPNAPVGNANIDTLRCDIPGDCSGWGFSITSSNALQDTAATPEQISWDAVSAYTEAGFFWADPGSKVTIATDSELVYEVNLLPATIHLVKAWRTFTVSNIRELITVPNTYYTTRMSDFNGYTVTEVVFDRPLSSRGEGWEDEIFVTQTSSVGPNPVDIMEWLITKYTSFGFDSTFATVKAQVDKYPMNFMVPGRKNILNLLQEMCWQGRMAIALRDDQFTLTYLSEEPIQDGTITDSDVLANSLVLDHTDTEDLVTKFVAEWRPECYLDKPYSVILRYNVKRYGTNEGVFDFYCYNFQELVIKSATFWLIRMANTWRKIICKTPISKLALETLDGCFVTLSDIASAQIKCRVETAVYNSADHTIDFVLQTPVRAGEMTAFPFHYPANIDVSELHPINEDIQFGNAGGSGPNVDVEAPPGHVLGKALGLRSGTVEFAQKDPCQSILAGSGFRPQSIQDKCRPDQGDQQPSDTDDVKPTVDLQSDNSSVPESQSSTGGSESSFNGALIVKNDLQQAGANAGTKTQLNNAVNTGTGNTTGAGANGGAGTGGGDSDAIGSKEDLESKPNGDTLEEQNKCHWWVKVLFITPVTTVKIPTGEDCNGSPCNAAGPLCPCSESGKQGCVVGNAIVNVSETFFFDDKDERDNAANGMQKMVSAKGFVGQNHPMIVTTGSYSPAGCVVERGPDDPKNMIGYEKNSNNDGTTTIVGYQGFMDTGGITAEFGC